MQKLISEEIVKIQPKGLITIPVNLRKELGFDESGLARVKKEKGRLIVEPVRTLPYPVRAYTKEEIKEFIKLDRKEAKGLKKKGLL